MGDFASIFTKASNIHEDISEAVAPFITLVVKGNVNSPAAEEELVEVVEKSMELLTRFSVQMGYGDFEEAFEQLEDGYQYQPAA